MSPHGSQSRYGRGCRCRSCTDAHAAAWKERRARHKAGIPSDYDRIDPGPAREALAWMVDQGMRWTQIEAITGMDRTSMNRVMHSKTHVARSTERIVLDAVRRIKGSPGLLTRDALLLPAAWTKWQFGALMARGWHSDTIAEAAGVAPPARKSQKVQRKVAGAIDRVFHDLHTEWGPNRRTAVRMWRVGKFPADCYLWEDQDIRPIPGSLRPELVAEALEYSRVHRSQAEGTRDLLRQQGQWARPICARTAMHNWNLVMGNEIEDYEADPPTDAWVKGRSPWCHSLHHDHSVPAYWVDEPVVTMAWIG